MYDSMLKGLKNSLITCSLLFFLLLPAISFAAPSLLLLEVDSKQTTMDAPEGLPVTFAPNLNLLKQLRQEKIAEMNIPVGSSIVLFKLKKQYIRDQIVTWQGSDASGNIQMVFTMGINHLYGRVTSVQGVFVYAPDPPYR